MTVPKEHVVDKEKVLSDLEKYKNEGLYCLDWPCYLLN